MENCGHFETSIVLHLSLKFLKEVLQGGSGLVKTSSTLFPGESETVVFKPKTPLESFHVIVDDEQKNHPLARM